LSTANPTWTDLGSNPGLRGGRPAANRMSHGTALAQAFSHRTTETQNTRVKAQIIRNLCDLGLWEPFDAASMRTVRNLNLLWAKIWSGDARWSSMLRHCITGREVAGSIPGGVAYLILPAALRPWGRLSL
jgi:hypothetical protein